MATCLSIVGLILLVITNLAIVIAFATPFWLESSGLLAKLQLKGPTNYGLWATCDDSDCTWRFQEGFKSLVSGPIWFNAVQGLFGVGLFLGLLSLLMATIALCCESRKCSMNHALAGILLLAFLSLGIAVILYGVKQHELLNAGVFRSPTVLNTFSWSFWLGTASSVLALITAVMFAFEGRRYEYYDEKD